MHQINLPKHALSLARERGQRVGLIRNVETRMTALLVIDMQNAFVTPGAPLHISTAREIVPGINRLAAALRSAGGLVCWIQTSFVDQFDSWSVFFADRLNETAARNMIEALTPGRQTFELYPHLEISEQDMREVKTRFSPFALGASDLNPKLKERGIDSLIIVGTVSNTCCESTARDAMMLNYRTIFVADANATRTDEEHNATLANMVQTFAEVATVDEIVGQLR